DYASDPAGDSLTFIIDDAAGGTATLNKDGHTVTFVPLVGFSGGAGFHFRAADIYATSVEASVDVNVSAAQLIKLDFVQRNPHLELNTQSYGNPTSFPDDESTDDSGTFIITKPVDFSMGFIGDFADEKGVLLPA
ncbi:Ig-like domain-containing protein, partial [Xanthomonas citri pv. citri]